MKTFKVKHGNRTFKVFADSGVEAIEKVRAVADGHATELKLLAPLEGLVQKWRAWKSRYKVLFDLEKKYWNNWDGYRSTLQAESPEKYKKFVADITRANKEIQPVIDQWNRIASGALRRGEDDILFYSKIHKLEPETFPESHIWHVDLDAVLEDVRRRINFQRRDSRIADAPVCPPFPDSDMIPFDTEMVWSYARWATDALYKGDVAKFDSYIRDGEYTVARLEKALAGVPGYVSRIKSELARARANLEKVSQMRTTK